MSDENINKVVIIGGGTAGWMTAAALANIINHENCKIELVESDNIGTVGVGEATIPEIVKFNKVLGVEEQEFLRVTKGSFKLGIEFVNWGKIGDSYIHPFGSYGTHIDSVQFYHYWQKYYLRGEMPDISEFAVANVASREDKFVHPNANAGNSPLAQFAYAYHFDAGLYAQYLRSISEKRGVVRTEGEVTGTNLDKSSGHIASVQLKSGRTIAGDLFVDCSGFRGLLIEQALNTGFNDWSNELLCDTAVTVGSEKTEPLPPYTRATAHKAGWQWRIPLQHRTGNGHVFCSKYISEDEATQVLLDNIEGKLLGEPRAIKFKTGMRKKFWNKNCVAIGLSSGFMEPLESTSIHLIYSGISKLMGLFPTKAFHQAGIDKYNRMMEDEFESIKIFLILHYYLNQRDDSDFWRYCRTMEIDEKLKSKLDLYASSGRIYREYDELFDEPSWLAVMHGQGLRAKSYHPMVDSQPEEAMKQFLRNVHQVINKSVKAMPTHEDYLNKLINR